MPLDNAIVQRIAKLLKLTRENGATEHEQIAAIAKAQEIALKENIDINSLDVSGIELTKEIIESAYWPERLYVNPQIRNLAATIAEHFRCKTIAYVTRNNKKAKYISFVGTPQDAEIAKTTFLYAMSVVKDNLRKYMKQRQAEAKKEGCSWGRSRTCKIRDSYMKTFAAGVDDALKDNAVKFGLVTAIPQEVQDYIAKNTVKTKQYRKTRTAAGDWDAEEAGYRQGYDSLRDREMPGPKAIGMHTKQEKEPPPQPRPGTPPAFHCSQTQQSLFDL
jgi:hypothetical protein